MLVWVRGRWLACCACLLLAGVLAGVLVGCGGDPPAVVHRVVGEGFGSFGNGPGQLFEPNGIAVDQQSGDVFVVDSDNARVDRFSSSGRFLYAWGWGIAEKTKPLVAQRCSSRCVLGIEGPGVGQFQFPEGIAVDNSPSSASRGDVYVVDIGNHRIQKFTPAGGFVWMIGNGVNDVTHAQGYPASENLCPVNRGDICGPGSEAPSHASAASQLEFAVEGDFIAVGADGTLYVGQRNHVSEFTPQGLPKTQVKLSPPPQREKGREAGGVSALAVNSAGDIYVVRHGVSGVREYTPTGRPLHTLETGLEPAGPEGPTPALAIDTNNNLYIDIHINKQQHRIDEYNTNGVKVASFDENQPDGLHGLAYSKPANRLYIVNTSTTNNTTHIRTTTPP
jgi:NHL repeat-containing protein